MIETSDADPFDLKRQFDGLDISDLSVLNLGSGKFDSLISRQLLEMPFFRLINVDGFHAYVQHSRTLRFKTSWVSYYHSDITDWLSENTEQFDVVLLLDVVEHFGKQAGKDLIIDVCRIATRRVLIWIPIGPCPQDMYDSNPLQLHRSTWELEDFQHLPNTRIEYFPEVHKHFNPPVHGAWVIVERGG